MGVTKQEEGIVLKVEVPKQDNTFSCFFHWQSNLMLRVAQKQRLLETNWPESAFSEGHLW